MAGEHHASTTLTGTYNVRELLEYVLIIDEADALVGSSEADHRPAVQKEDQGGRGLYSGAKADDRSPSTV